MKIPGELHASFSQLNSHLFSRRGTVEFRRMMTGRSILGVAIPQTATYDCARVELSNCFCGHCSAISIERFRRKVSFSGIAGVSKWMARRSTNTVRHSALIDAILYVYRTLDSSVFSNRFFYYIVSRNRHIIIPPIKSWR